MAVSLDFVLDGAGWASLEITTDTFVKKLDGISYLTDALDDLLRMGIDIATDKGWTFARFDHEPATSILVAETGWWEGDNWEAGARLSLILGENISVQEVGWQTIHAAKREFVIHLSSRDALAKMILDAAERVRDRYGEEGYGQAWGGRLAFPVRGVKALQAALDCPPLPQPNYAA